MAWELPDGRRVPLRCGASNKCAYCAFLTALENALVVHMDAKLRQPTFGITLTTKDADFDLEQFRRAVAAVFKRLRRHYGRGIEYLGFMEWTTGERTPGKRPHMHALVKGLAELGVSEAELHTLVRATWEASTDGSWVVESRPLMTPAGAIAYLTMHHHKMEQAPPPGFTGKRLRPSQGYYERPIAQLREEAKVLLHNKRVRRAVEMSFTDEMPDFLIDQVVDEVLKLPAPVLVKRDHRGDYEIVPTTSRTSDRAMRWRSWNTVGAPYA